MPCLDGTCGANDPNAPLDGDPGEDIEITANSDYGGILVSWSYPTLNPFAIAHFLLYRGTSDDFTTAVEVGVVAGSVYFDSYPFGTEEDKYYWIKTVSIHGTYGKLRGPAFAKAKPTIEQILILLSGKMSSTLLSQELKNQIEVIPLLGKSLNDEIEARMKAEALQAKALGGAQGAAENAITIVENEVVRSKTAHSSLINAIDIMATGFGNSTAGFANTVEIKTGPNSAFAQKLTNLDITVNGDTSTAQIGLTGHYDAVTKQINTMYTAKFSGKTADGNQIIGGFGIGIEDGYVNAAFDADRFYIGRPNSAGILPFMLSEGKVYINSAVIRNLDAEMLTAGTGIIGKTLKSLNNNEDNTIGWRIERDGYATFQQATMRGTVIAERGSIGGVVIENEGIRTSGISPAPKVTVEDPSKARPVKSMATTGSATPSTILLLDSGEVMGYGYSASGLFGVRYQGASETMTPTLLKSAGGSPFITNVSAVDAGEKFFAFLKRDGTVWITGEDITGSRELSPCQLTGFTDVVSISASQSFLAMLTASGQVFVRGTAIRVICYDNDLPDEAQNYNNPLNLNDTTARLLGARVVKIAAGGDHLVLLDANGVVWAAGGTHMGQCGPATKDGVGMSVLMLDGVGIADAVRATDIWAGDLYTMYAAKVTQGAVIKAGDLYSFGQPIPCPAISMDYTYYDTVLGVTKTATATYSNEYASWLSPKPIGNIPSFSTIIRARGLLPTLVTYGDVGDTFRVAIGGGLAGLPVDYRRMIIKRVRSNGVMSTTCSGYEGFVVDLPASTQMNSYATRGSPTYSHKYGQHGTFLDGWGDEIDIYIGPFFITYRSRVTGMLLTTCDPDLVKWSGVTDEVLSTSGPWGSRFSRVNTWAGFTIDIDDPNSSFVGTGFGLKSDGKFMIGSSTGNKLEFNNNKLIYRGSLDVKSSTDTNTSRMEISDTCIKVFEGSQLRVIIGKLP